MDKELEILDKLFQVHALTFALNKIVNDIVRSSFGTDMLSTSFKFKEALMMSISEMNKALKL